MNRNGKKKIWIDLDNSPHVPFFRPIIAELEKRDYKVVITARDCFQVCGLADLAGIEYRRIGRHYGKHTVLKVIGLLVRAIQMAPTILRNKPTVAVSHGSRTQQLLATLLGIPNIMIFDYEYASALLMLQPSCVVIPDVISDNAVRFTKSQVYKYPGIKEDVYVPDFKADPGIRKTIGITDSDILVTIRPPASEAHYRSPESEKLFAATVEHLSALEDVKVVMLPRNEKQDEQIRAKWPELFSKGKIIIPREVVDGLNLIWYSDLVISGGGTMNREAAALGVPVYSIFRGKTGAVDKYLAKEGRLTLLETPDDVRAKILAVRRPNKKEVDPGDRAALKKIVAIIEKVADKC